LKRESIDLIITDWMLPGMSGPELIQKLHSQEEFAAIPTILLTAKSDESSRSEGMRVGASAYLSKPFDYRELISITENLLDLKKRERKILELNRFINENVLQRFLPPALVKDLVSGKAVFDDAARMHSITVLFADLVDFTRSTERLGPSRIARILNAFLVSMTDVIFSEGGTIDKFIGDAILVFFGAPTQSSPAQQIEQATRCALRMQEALIALNKEWQTSENHSFQMRIGIHHGPAIVGSFGGQKRSDYTAIGHTVNLASRIEGQAGPGEVLMTASVRDFLSDECWEYAGSFKMKGVEGETALYRLKPLAIKSAA
jgi:class 3 adenylate cyclase